MLLDTYVTDPADMSCGDTEIDNHCGSKVHDELRNLAREKCRYDEKLVFFGETELDLMAVMETRPLDTSALNMCPVSPRRG